MAQPLQPDAQGGARLPEPGPDELAHGERVQALIREEIAAAGGSIEFARFMELALYAPGLGYYSAGARKLGAGGDFVTAPEVSPLFGACIANQCAPVLEGMPGGVIMEFGAGTGRLACDIMQRLRALDALPAEYLILETSADLRARQQALLKERLGELSARVRWLDCLPVEPVDGVVLANEVLDAMPVQRFRIEDNVPRALRVRLDGGGFGWQTGEFDDAGTRDAISRRLSGHATGEGYESECNLLLCGWLGAVSDSLGRGMVLLIDYGMPRAEYYHAQRDAGTLMCHYRHRAHPDPFVHVGLQDITAHVDFTAVAEAADAAGLAVGGYTTQAFYLLASGLDALLADSDPEDAARHLALAQQVKTLTLPGEMGERFKVMALASGEVPVGGFEVRDLRSRL